MARKLKTKKLSFDEWYKKVPDSKRDTSTYNLRRAYELAPRDQLDKFIKDPEAHLYSAYENKKTGEYEFVKSKDHPTINEELNWYNSEKGKDFKNKYDLDTSGDYYKYVPKLQNGIDTIQRPRSTAMQGMKFNTAEEAKDYFDSLYPGSNPTQLYKSLPDKSAPVEVRTFKGQKELDRVISTGDIMDKKAKEHIRDIIGEPKLADGIDRTNVSLLSRVPSVGNSDFKINNPELKATATTPIKSKGIKMDSAAISGIGNIAGSLVGTQDKLAGNVVSGVGQGAAAGMSVGGPAGAVVGGLAMGAVNLIKGSQQKKEQERAEQEAVENANKARVMSNIQPSQNTQSPIYEDGTYAAGMTQPVEVEKDELVLRKNSLGKYNVVADFKGGKTHNKGGEDYVLKEGDVVFPGKKRSTIMNHLKTNNHSGIESERMKLPKDLPDTGELKDGVRGLPKYPLSTEDVFGITDTMTPEQIAMETLRWRSEGGVSAPKPSNLPEGILPDTTGQMPSWLQGEAVPQNQTQNSTGVTTTPNTNVPKTSEAKGTINADRTDPNISIEPWMLNENFNERQDQDIKLESWMMEANTPTNAITNEPSIPTPETRQDGDSQMSNVLSGIGDYAPSIAHVIRGLQKPETETRRFLTPETQQYKDTSELLRKESDIQSRVDMENAARFSGGSGQVARAGKSLAGAARFKRSQAISTGEAQRAQGIEAQNIATRNQASANNLQLANQYDAMDAQNRAAIDAYFNQGIHDIGRVTQQRKMDKKAESQQSLMLKMLEDRNFRYDEKGNLVEFKG